MNPFDLHGPEFLLFYIGLSALVIIGVVMLRRKAESGPIPRIDLSDPLLIAFLRGGHSEAMRVTAVSLIHRKLLLCIGTSLQTAPHRTLERNQAHERFLSDPTGEALRAGLSPDEIEAVKQIDQVGLELFAVSLERKRQRQHK